MAKTLKINLDENVASEKRVSPDKVYNNLAILKLSSIEVTINESLDSKVEYDFHGMKVPNLVMKWEQVHSDGIPRFLTYTFKPVVLTTNKGDAMTEDMRGNIHLAQYQKVKHIFDAYKAKHKLTLPQLALDTTKEKYLEAIEKWYQAMVSWFTVDGKPIYLDEKGVSKKVVFKLILNKDAKSVNIPDYINDGFCELARFDTQGKLITGLEIKANERVVFTPVNPASFTPGFNSAPNGTLDVTDL
jgi:hypothetical protein